MLQRTIKTPQELRNVALAMADLLYPRNGLPFVVWYPKLCEQASIACSPNPSEWEDMTICEGLELLSYLVSEYNRLLVETMELADQVQTIVA